MIKPIVPAKPIAESTTLAELDERLETFRLRFLRTPESVSDNAFYLAWCDGVKFGSNLTRKIYGSLNQPVGNAS
jgi:hypothetical protein